MVFPKPPLYLDYLKTEKENLGQQQHHEPTHVQKKKKRTSINLCSSPNHLPLPVPRPVPIVLGNFWATFSVLGNLEHFSLSEYFMTKIWI